MAYFEYVGRPVLAMLIIAAATLRASANHDAVKSAAELQGEYAQLDADYRRELEHLSHVAFSRGWATLGERARGWRPAPPATGSLIFIAPDAYSRPEEVHTGKGDSPPDAQPWRDQFDELRRKHSESLFQLAKRAADARQPSLAFQWVTESLREDPEHPEGRRVLGYEKRDGKWLTSYGAKMADAGKTWHAKYGWIAAADVPRYESGERLVGDRWTSEAVDAARHADMRNGWQVRSDHFQVTTNHSLEAAAELAARLERLHQAWRQLFAGYYLSEREVAQLFAGDRNSRALARPFRVFYHRDRGQYTNALRRRQPRIAETLGIYFDTNREAHFFAGEAAAGGSPTDSPTAGPAVATLYHEGVHQLFQESKPTAKRIGDTANFWVIEGVATYFETLAEHPDPNAGLYFTVGETTSGRLPAARERLKDGYYVPLAELTRLGKSDVQRHAEIAKLYSQSSGLVAFLMNSEQGRYREPLVRYLQAVYSGRDHDDTLANECGASYEELDAAYRRYLESLP